MIETVTGFLSALFWFMLLLGPLVFIHELGHFLAAKRFGVRCDVFSIGFGPRVLGFLWRGTDYRLSLLPLGGYVKMLGESENEDEPNDPESLSAKPRWQRLIVFFAGPVMNVILACSVWWGLLMYGYEVPEPPTGPPVIGQIVAASPAERAGLRPGDIVVGLGGKAVASYEEWAKQHNLEVLLRPGQSIEYAIDRAGQRQAITVEIGRDGEHGSGYDGVLIRSAVMVAQVRPGEPAEKAGLKVGDLIASINGQVPASADSVAKLVQEHGNRPLEFLVTRSGQQVVLYVEPSLSSGSAKIGIATGPPLRLKRLPPLEAALESVRHAWEQSGFLLQVVKRLVTLQLGVSALSGPVGIARVAQEQAQAGLIPFMTMLAFFSLQLGLLNLLPIPALDGGHILTISAEGLLRRDLPSRLKERLLLGGVVFLLLITAVVLVNDVLKGRRTASPAPAASEAAPAR